MFNNGYRDVLLRLLENENPKSSNNPINLFLPQISKNTEQMFTIIYTREALITTKIRELKV